MALDPLAHVLDHTIHDSGLTKYQVLLVVAAGIVAALYIPFARRIANGVPPRGVLSNFLEMLLLFVRDEVARPNIGNAGDSHHGEQVHEGEHHPSEPHNPFSTADRYLPFLWTLFLFILTCNLLGMVPFLGAPTADIGVTLALAAIVFVVIHVSSVLRNGPVGYIRSFIPSLKGDNLIMTVFLVAVITPLIAVIEVMGAVIRATVLAIRLFANLFAGHVALGVILLFAVAVREEAAHVAGGVTLATILMGTALSVLELFVAFLQAFVFTLLSAIFLGMQLNPEH